MTRQERKVYNKQYRLDNPRTVEQKAANRVYARNWYRDNPLTDEEKAVKCARDKQRRLDNPAVVLKVARISHWKGRGVVCDDFDSLHDWYLAQDICQICSVVLTTGEVCPTRRVLDHCHITGYVRGIVCMSCNSSLPRQQ